MATGADLARKGRYTTQMVPLYILVLPLAFSLKSSEVCYPSVVRHRIDSVFPTSRLFCVSKQNDDIRFGEAEIVYSEPTWNSNSEELPKVLMFGRPSKLIRTFKLPAALSDSDFCTGTQSVEVNRNLTVRCKPLSTSDLLSQCTENVFLNARALLGEGEFVETVKNETRTVRRTSSESLTAPAWNETKCQRVLKSATLVFHLNQSIIIDSVEIHVEYVDLEMGNRDFEQTISVEFVEFRGNVSIENQLDRGYRSGDAVLRVENSTSSSFTIPSLGPCSSAVSTQVFFDRSITSICTIPTSSCEDARAKARDFYEKVYPSELTSGTLGDPARVGRVNVTWEQQSPSTTSCRLPVSSLLQIYHSKQGSIHDFREVIVAGNVQLLLDDVDYLPGQQIRMPISITFTDVTQPPKSIFASLPYIDIRLPHDFFYPFVSSSTAFNFSFHLVFVVLLVFLF